MLTLALALLVSATPAAAPAPAAPQSDAERFFEEGRLALKANEVAKACEAFTKSHQLQPALGVLLNLASCLEKQGKLGSAWVRFNEAITWAVRTHEGDREQFAREHATSLKPRVSWLSLTAAKDVEVVIDDGPPLALAPASPTAVPVDTGSHQVVARATGFEAWTTTVTVSKPGATASVAVPALKASTVAAATPAPVTVVPAQPDPGPPPPPPPLVIVQAAPSGAPGMALIVAGGAALVAGGIGVGWSLSTYDSLQGQRVPVLDPEIRVSRGTFDQLKWIYPASWAVAGIGVAAAITGAVLMVRGSSAPRVTPVVGPGGAGLAVSGTF